MQQIIGKSIGKYSNREKEILLNNSHLPISDISTMLNMHGYNRSMHSIKTKLSSLKEDVENHKRLVSISQKENANKDLLNYRSKSLFHAAKARASKKGIDFSLTLEWITEKVKKGKCEATNKTLVLTPFGDFKRTRKLNPYAPSLDRIDSKLGYTVENTQVTIASYNRFKSDMSQHEMVDIAKAIVKNHVEPRQFQVQA